MRAYQQRSSQGAVAAAAVRALAVLCLAAVGSLGLAAPAWAADYRCAQVDTTAEVETNGSITVVDQRIFEFVPEDEAEEASEAPAEEETSADEGADGQATEDAGTVGAGDTPADNAAQTRQLPDTSAAVPTRQTLKWLYDGFGEDAEITIKRVRMAQVDAEGNVTGSWHKLKSTTFLLSWRDGGGPEKDAWSYDKYRSTLYAFITNSSDRVVFEVTYRVRHAVVAYDDAADLSWEYAPRDYPVDLHNVTAEVVLPVPADEKVVPGDNVRAWGHGPAEGTVDVERDGSVTFFDPQVSSEAYALGRVMFPVQWLTNLPEEDRLAHQGTLQFEPTTRYEESWVDRESYQKLTRDGLAGSLLALCALMLVAGVGAYLRWGRQKPPRFTDNYASAVPAPGLAPAVMGRLWRWNHVSSDDLVATLVDMVRRGAIEVQPPLAEGEDAVRSRQLVFAPWCVEEEALAAGQAVELQVAEVGSTVEVVFEEGINHAGDEHEGRSALDEPTRRLLTLVSQGEPTLSADQLLSFAHRNPGALLRAVDAWQQTLTAKVEPEHFFDRRSQRVQRVMLVAAAVLAVLALVACFTLGWVTGLLALVSAAALGVLANYTMRRTVEGNELTAHAKALRNWMHDGGVQQQRAEQAEASTPEDELVPYALLFGVVDRLPATPLTVFAQRLSQVLEEALRGASRRAEVAGSTGEAPIDTGVEPHWRPFWRRSRRAAEDTIDDDF